MRRIITNHYARIGVPEHFWLGVTCEDNRVKRVLDILRATKDRVGDFTAFSSVEPAEAATAETRRLPRRDQGFESFSLQQRVVCELCFSIQFHARWLSRRPLRCRPFEEDQGG
jgi:hypothetical protein